MKSPKIWFLQRRWAIRHWRNNQRRKIVRFIYHVRYRAPLWLLDLAAAMVRLLQPEPSTMKARRLELLKLTRRLWSCRSEYLMKCRKCGSPLREMIETRHGGTLIQGYFCHNCGDTHTSYLHTVDF